MRHEKEEARSNFPQPSGNNWQYPSKNACLRYVQRKQLTISEYFGQKISYSLNGE